MNGRQRLALGLLAVFFLPLTTRGGVAVNYSFFLLVLISRYSAGRGEKNDAKLFVIFLMLSYLIGVLFISRFEPVFLIRQGISFVAFLAPVALLFARLPFGEKEICRVVLWLSIAYSLYVLWIVLGTGKFNLQDAYAIKSGLRTYVPDWPQRYVILLIFSLFIAVDQIRYNKLYAVVFLVILSCIFLTYIRAAFISVAAGFLALGAVSIVHRLKQKRRWTFSRKDARRIAFIGAVGLVLIIVVLGHPSLYGSVRDLFQNAFTSIGEYFKSEAISDYSASERTEYWNLILDVVSRVNPVTGMGFAGIYLFRGGEEIGSAHSQYMDVLLRIGFAGLIFYLYFWGKAFRAFYRKGRLHVVAGLFGLFVFGFFHETTKLPYGALLFYLLLNAAGRTGADTGMGEKR